MREQGVDLKGAHQTAPHPLLGREAGDVGAIEHNAAGIRPQHAGDEIDQCGFAGAVRTDQRVAGAGRQIELDVESDDQRAEALAEATDGQRDLAHGVSRLRSNNERPPRIPFGSIITTAIKMRPIQKYQYCGLSPENWSRAII